MSDADDDPYTLPPHADVLAVREAKRAADAAKVAALSNWWSCSGFARWLDVQVPYRETEIELHLDLCDGGRAVGVEIFIDTRILTHVLCRFLPFGTYSSEPVFGAAHPNDFLHIYLSRSAPTWREMLRIGRGYPRWVVNTHFPPLGENDLAHPVLLWLETLEAAHGLAALDSLVQR